jgi:hypothetical protein
MKNILKALQRPLYAIAALALLVGVTATSVVPGFASAYGEVTNRSIEISSAQQSATAEYTVKFTLTSAAKSVALDFCDTSPLYADTCGAPAGFTVASATLSSQTGSSGWAIVGAATSATHLEIGGATQAAASTTVTLVLANITNPSSLGGFFGRIYTYGVADPDWTAVATPGTVVDFGGIALSTAEAVQVTARVQEKLQFCVSATVMSSNDCTGQTTPAITIGSGTPKVLDTTTSTAPAYVQVSTNAGGGVSVRMKNSNATCTNPGGLSRDGGTTCDIGPANGGAAVSAALSGAEFGLYCTPDAGLTAQAPYSDSATPTYGMDTVSAQNVTTTYGSQILTSAGALDGVNSVLTFGAQSALTTPAGVYTASMDLIATGVF